jgi:hypothetical protein
MKKRSAVVGGEVKRFFVLKSGVTDQIDERRAQNQVTVVEVAVAPKREGVERRESEQDAARKTKVNEKEIDVFWRNVIKM